MTEALPGPPIIRITNVGDASAERIVLQLYIDKGGLQLGSERFGGYYPDYGGLQWQPLGYDDETQYQYGYKVGREHPILQAKASMIFDLFVLSSSPEIEQLASGEELEIKALLKVFYYPAPEPVRVPFTIIIHK